MTKRKSVTKETAAEALADQMEQSNGQLKIPTEQVVEMQFNKIGKMNLQIDIMSQQLQIFEKENRELKAEIAELKKGKK